MMYFDCGDKRYHLRHNNSDDSRSVIQCEDVSFAELVRFDSRLNVLKGGHQVGYLRVSYDTDEWMLVDHVENERPLDVNCDSYSWQNILLAEVQAAKLLLK